MAKRHSKKRGQPRWQMIKLGAFSLSLLFGLTWFGVWVHAQMNQPPAWLGLPTDWQEFSNPTRFSAQLPDNLALQELPESQEDLALKEQLQTVISPLLTKLNPHIYYLDIKTGQYVNINGTHPTPAASVIKLPLFLEYYRARTEGKILASQQFFFDEIHSASGSGDWQYLGAQKMKPGVDVATSMIQNSDNSATNMFIDYLGGMQELNQKFRRMGLQGTYLHNWLPDLAGTNVISQRDMAKILYNIAYTDYLCPNCKQEAIEILKGCHNNRLIPAGLPPELEVAHKTGDIGTSLGDSALVMVPGGESYLLSIQVERPHNDFQAKELIIALSKLIYEHHQMNSTLAQVETQANQTAAQ
jgi:beta-lactamase class A